MDLAFLASATAALFAIIDPFAIVPAFISITQGIDHATKMRIVRRATITALAVLMIFGLVGHVIFSVMGFTIHAFRIAGGILLFTVGFKMLYGQRPRTKFDDRTDKEKTKAEVEAEKEEEEEIGVVPVGIPLIAGPGAITTLMIYTSESSVGLAERTLVFVIMAIVVLVVFMSLKYADAIFSRIGRMGSLAISRIMGLILAAIAVQFIIDGIMGVARLYDLI